MCGLAVGFSNNHSTISSKTSHFAFRFLMLTLFSRSCIFFLMLCLLNYTLFALKGKPAVMVENLKSKIMSECVLGFFAHQILGSSVIKGAFVVSCL